MPKGKKKAAEVIEVKVEAATENPVTESSANITSELQNVELTHNEEGDVTGAKVTEEETQTQTVEEVTTAGVATEAEQVVAETVEATEGLTTINTAEALDAKKEAEAAGTGEKAAGEETEIEKETGEEENKETQTTTTTTNSDGSVVYTKNGTSTRVDTNPFGRKTISYEPIINKEEAVIKAKIVLGKRGETRIRPDGTEYIR